MVYATAFGAMVLFVALKAFQQLNVVHDQYKWVLPVSIGMGFCEVYIIAQVATQGFGLWLALAIGLGGAVGAMFSMWLHKRMRK